MSKYDTKAFKTIEEQIELLKARGMNFHNETVAKEILLKRNYFDIINGFETLALIDPANPPKKYKTNSYFEDFVDLYEFDRALSSVVLKIIASLESRLKSSLSYRFCEDVYGSDSSAAPDSYINLLMYENPYSIHNRVSYPPNGTITGSFVNKLNHEIRRFVNAEIQNLESKFNQLPTSLQYINTKDKIEDSLNECNALITKVTGAIQSLNNDISFTPAVRRTGTRIIQINNFTTSSVSVTLILANSGAAIKDPLNNFDKLIKEIILRLGKLYARIAPNNNRTFHNVAHKEIEGFMAHKLFNTNYEVYNRDDLNYIEHAKEQERYLQTYTTPPFWVIVKKFEFGFTLKLLYGLKSHVLDKIIIDLGLRPAEKIIFLNSLKIINDLRNHCAHFHLINRFRTYKNTKIDSTLINKLGLQTKSNGINRNGSTHYAIGLYDALKVLSQFENLEAVNLLFEDLFTSPELEINEALNDSLLDRMGNMDKNLWCMF